MPDNVSALQHSDKRPSNRAGQQSGSLTVPEHTPPQRIYLIPVTHRPFLPGLVQPVMLEKARWQQTLEPGPSTNPNLPPNGPG